MVFMKRLLLACLVFAVTAAAQPAEPQASFVDASHSTLRLDIDGKQYLVDVAAGTVRPAVGSAQPGADAFSQRCAGCHGADGRGIGSAGTPDFTNRAFQAKL